MYFFMGALGSILILSVFVSGVALGWKARGKMSAETAPVAASDSDRQQNDYQEAIRQMQGYTADIAYGITEFTPGGDRS